MDKTYNPKNIESSWYQLWEEEGFFSPSSTGDPYCIMLPPPNVTGNLHMGHAFQQTLMDVLIRYHRMNGNKSLWQCGTDHAGIATQMVVERQLEMKGQNRLDLGREKFTDAVWKWKEESGNTITNQSRRLGTSMDWSRERFTMDDGLSEAVKEVFVRLHEEGLIYRGKRLVNWDPVLHTAISDLEVISEEENGSMWHIRYPRCDGKGHVIVATTRPETMLGDAAVAVHPEDDRYRDLIGQDLELPLTGRRIPVIADEYVDPEFGTGCVKITPAHDFNDYEVGSRHTLPLINVLTHDAMIISQVGSANTRGQNDNTDTRDVLEDADAIGIPQSYRGKDRFEARKLIIQDLEAAGLMEKTEPHKLMVPRGDRSGAVIEPYLTDQWYVKIKPLAEPAIAAVENGDIQFVPKNWDKTYYEWMRNIEDWCISRQLWWGHQIPAWYDPDGNIFVGRNEHEVREKHSIDPSVILKQDEDVLDTWFSSALWPFSTLGWPDKTPELDTFYPTSVLVTGFDIIFFWVARMIMMGIKFMGKVPFREVYIHGLVRDAEGKKMSKSKGNILDPLDLIDGIELEELITKRTKGLMRPRDAEKITKQTHKHYPDGIESYGTDALRFTFAALATQGRGINFDVGRISGYRNFCNKIWNASRYVLMNLEASDIKISEGETEFGLAENWINARFSQAIEEVNTGITTYRFDLAAQAIYEFTWDEYCDWYLELSKTTLTDESASEIRKRGTLLTLITILEQLLRLMHPFMPFITEEIWQRARIELGIEAKTIMQQSFPTTPQIQDNQNVLNEMSWVKLFILGVRRIRSERDIAPGKALAVQVKGGSADEQTWLDLNTHYIKSLGKITTITSVEESTDDAIITLAGDMTILVPLADLIDPKSESARLEKELNRLNNDKQRIESKLNNSNFIDRAPEDVVNKEKQKLDDTLTSIQKLEDQHQRILKLL
jgi:valyl-tRNA synthetase